MKKYVYGIVSLVILVCVSFTAGCFKADKATLETNVAKFRTDLLECKQVDSKNLGCGILDSGYNFTFIIGDTNINLKTYVNNESLSYNLLNKGNELDFLLQNASNYFIKRFDDKFITLHQDKLSTIPQKLNTDLYYNIEEVKGKLNEFKTSYNELSFTLEQNNAKPDSTANKKNLVKLIKSYEDVINVVFKMNFTAQQIHDYYLFNLEKDYGNLIKIPDNEIKRLAETYSLYISNYIFQREMLFSNDKTVRFKDNVLYKNLKSMQTKLNDKIQNNTLNNNNEDARHLRVFKYLRTMEEDLMQEKTINENALSLLKNKIPSQSEDVKLYTVYDNFYTQYEQKMLHYVELLTELVG